MSMEEDLSQINPCSNSSNVNGGVSSSVATTMDDDTALYSLHNPSSPSAVSSVNDNGDFDRVLYQNLVDMVPLVESLMERRATTSFTRRGSMIYTKTPKDLNSKKNADPKGRKAAQVTSTKVRKDAGGNALDTTSRKDARGGSVEEHSILKSMSLKEMEELLLLRVQVEELQKKLLEKDKALSSAEESLKQLNFVCREVEVLKRQIEEKESQLRSARLQISDAKIRVADRQAIAEKAQWEAKISNRKAEEVQKEIDYLNHEINLFMRLFDSCKMNEQKEDGASQKEDQDSCEGSQILCTPLEESEIEKIEEAKKTYWSAIAAAKQKDNEESLFSASEARSQLQSFLSREYNYQVDMGKYVKLLHGLSYHPAEGLSH